MQSEKIRCGWCGTDPLYVKYHDEEWGVPVRDDQTMFEFLILETFQAGLSWITILRKRENFRMAFDDFDYKKIAKYNQNKIDSLLQDQGIVRNKLKVNAAVTNAQAFMDIQKEFGSFTEYIWSFVNGQPIKSNWKNHENAPATSKESDALSKDLKKRGFKFVGSTVMYAHMQATGLINDHIDTCFRYNEISATTSS